MGSRKVNEVWLRTVADVLKNLRPGDDEDSIFQREAAEAAIHELAAQPAPAGRELRERLEGLRDRWAKYTDSDRAGDDGRYNEPIGTYLHGQRLLCAKELDDALLASAPAPAAQQVPVQQSITQSGTQSGSPVKRESSNGPDDLAGMKVLDNGHRYLLRNLDGENFQILQFVKRQGENYPGNVGQYEGTTMQEVLRSLIDRCRYVQNQIPCKENEKAIELMREIIFLFESRAAHRHGRILDNNIKHRIERESTCPICGHIGCWKNCKNNP